MAHYHKFAGAAHDLDPKSLKAALKRSIYAMAHGSSLIYLLELNVSTLDGYFALNAMQMVLLSVIKLVSSQRATVSVLALITMRSSLLHSDLQQFAPLSHWQP